jgi:hypothetical protein
MNALSSLARAPHTGTTLGELTLSIAHSFSHANTHPPPQPPLLHTAQVNADAMAYPVSTCYSAAPCGFNSPCGAPCTAPVLNPALPSCRLSPSPASRTSRSLPLGSLTLVLLTALACRVQGLGFSSVLAHSAGIPGACLFGSNGLVHNLRR